MQTDLVRCVRQGDVYEKSSYKTQRRKVTENKETNSAEEALNALGLSIEDVQKAEDEMYEALGSRRYRTTVDPRICLCGHPVGRHTVVGGITFCKPARMECPCKKCRPVIEVDDVRKFLRKTGGAGPLHALTLGIKSLAESGKKAKWIVDVSCDRCGATDTPVVPVPVTQRGIAASHPTGYDALLCEKCRTEI